MKFYNMKLISKLGLFLQGTPIQTQRNRENQFPLAYTGFDGGSPICWGILFLREERDSHFCCRSIWMLTTLHSKEIAPFHCIYCHRF